MSDKLLQCPFCGEQGSLSVHTYDVQPDDYHGGYVTCSECDCQGADAISLNGWLSDEAEAKEAAVAAWNRRASQPHTEDGREDA